MMRILFVQPPKVENSISGIDLSLSEPLALEILSANLFNHDVKILDMRLEDNLEDVLLEFKPHIVATTAFTVEVYKSLDILRKVKEFNREILTIIGGHHATLVPMDFNSEFIDIVVIGEGEYTIREIVEAFEKKKGFADIKGIAVRNNGKLKFTEPRGNISDLDSLPFPNRMLTKKYRDNYFRGLWKPTASIYSSRGCPFKCDFCAMWKIFNGKFRTRSAKRFVDELETISEKFVNFTDDNSLQNISYAREIYNEIKKRNIKKTYKLYGRSDTIVKHPEIVEEWKSIGMELLLIGLESFNDDYLKARNKNNTAKNNEEAIKILHKNGVEVIAYFLVDPNFTEKDFNDLSNYVENLNLKHSIFTILTPFPGTELYEKRYYEMTTHNYELLDVFHAVLPTKLPLREFYINFINLYKKAYSKSDNKFISDDMVTKLTDKFMSAHNL